MAINIFGLTACNLSARLTEYKITAKETIENYADERQEYFRQSDWMILDNILNKGKTSVDTADNETAIDFAVATTKQEIDDAVATSECVGVFYSLQEAYESGLIVNTDLHSIASNLKNYSSNGCAENLSTEIKKAIKETRAFDLRGETNTKGSQLHPEAIAEDVKIWQYYGDYNDSFAVMLTDSYSAYTDAERSVTVADVVFNYSDGNSILIWKKDDMSIGTQAKQLYIDNFLGQSYPETTVKDVKFAPFLGIYGDSLVADFCNSKYSEPRNDIIIEYELAGLRFYFIDDDEILVYNKGKFWNLPRAYEQGLLTKENLAEIHRLYFSSATLENRIRKDYSQKILNRDSDINLDFDDVYINQFFGMYRDSVAVIIAVRGACPPPAIDFIEVEGFEFAFHSGYPILIWNDGVFYTMQNAVDEELLTIKDIETIHSLYKWPYTFE